MAPHLWKGKGWGKKPQNGIFELVILRFLRSSDTKKWFPNTQHDKYQSLGSILSTGYLNWNMWGWGSFYTTGRFSSPQSAGQFPHLIWSLFMYLGEGVMEGGGSLSVYDMSSFKVARSQRTCFSGFLIVSSANKAPWNLQAMTWLCSFPRANRTSPPDTPTSKLFLLRIFSTYLGVVRFWSFVEVFPLTFLPSWHTTVGH